MSDRIRIFPAEMLESKEPGLSGGNRVGAYPLEGLTLPNGEAADSVQNQILAVWQRVKTGNALPADQDTMGVVFLTAQPEDPENPRAVGDNDGRLSDARTPKGAAGGDLSGEYPNPEIAATGVTPGVYALATVEVGEDGRVLSIEEGAAGAVADASETQKGVVQIATEAEVREGPAGVLVANAARLKAELDRRMGARRGHFAGDGPTVWGGVNVPAGGSQVSADLRGVGGIPADAKGVFVSLIVPAQSSNRVLYVDSADAPNAVEASPSLVANTVGVRAQLAVGLGTGTNAGRIKMSALSTANVTGVTAYVNGWWR